MGAAAWFVLTVAAAATGPACYSSPQEGTDEAALQESTTTQRVQDSGAVFPSDPNAGGRQNTRTQSGFASSSTWRKISGRSGRVRRTCVWRTRIG